MGDIALHPDGRRIVGTLADDNGEVEPVQPLLTLVTNFFAELKARVPRADGHVVVTAGRAG